MNTQNENKSKFKDIEIFLLHSVLQFLQVLPIYLNIIKTASNILFGQAEKKICIHPP